MPITRLWHVGVAFVAAALGACTLSSQQLLLPSPPHQTHGERKQPGGAPLASLSSKRWAAEAVGTDKLTGRPSPRRRVVAGKDGVSLSIVEASVQEAAKSILGDVLGVTYTVSDEVKGTISIQTAKPVPKAALLEIFEDALRSAGAAIAVQRGTYRIVPSAEAVASAPLRGAGGKRQPGMGIHVVPLKHVAAAEMERIVKAIAPNANLLRTDKDRNLLVVAGTRSDMDAITDAVDVFDIDWMKGMSFGIYPLESADPEAVAKELDTVFANDRDSPSQGLVRFIPNRRLKSVLVISPRAKYLRRARAWIRRLDTATEATVKQVFIYPVRSRNAVELAGLLRRIYGQEQPTTAPKAPVQPPDAIEPATSLSSPAGALGGGRAPADGRVPDGRAAPAGSASPEPEAEPSPAPSATPPGRSGGPRDDRLAGISIIEDDANNALIITATAREYRRVRQILERIDVSARQVLLEATIAEVTLTDKLQMGVRWFFQAGNNELSFTDVVTEEAGNVVGGPFAGFSHFFSTTNIEVFFKALSSVTDVNVISSPTLMVLDNKEATLQVGDEVPVLTQTATGVTTGDAPIVNSVNYRNTGIVLNVTPRIGDKGRILLEIEQEASDVVASRTDIDSPTIQQRRIKTTVAVQDGEGLILGGLIQDSATNQRGQLPLLGDLPLLGNLFKDKDDAIERTELLLAITPRIIKDPEQSRAITEEFRTRINLSTRPQRDGPPDHREQVDRLIR